MEQILGFEISPAISFISLYFFILSYVIIFILVNKVSKKNTIFRFFLLIVTITVIINPIINREKSIFFKDIVLVVSDNSLSISDTKKTELILKAKEEIKEKINTFSNIEIRDLKIYSKNDENNIEREGTFFIDKIKSEINSINKERVSAVIIFTDGQFSDKPMKLKQLEDIPIHFILVGKKDEKDRVILIKEIPDYAIVGEKINFSIKVNSWENDKKVNTKMFLDGKIFSNRNFTPNKYHDISIPIKHSGENVLEVIIENDDDEITHTNNYEIKKINGIHDKLRVMLVSGEPNMGLRSWRNVLNSDPSIELIHFTILRPPSKRDLTPVKELSLIPFPSKELFSMDISKFSLIIFDQYSLQGVLPERYMKNITDFVLRGGALLDIAGSSHISSSSIINSPIKKILPSTPVEKVYKQAFIPQLTEIGKKHPITSGLNKNYKNKNWGKWYRYIQSKKIFGQTLLETNNNPIMIVSKVGEGRVAQMLSDQAWVWEKSEIDSGPFINLLRNTIHWLLKTPELDENFLSFTKLNNTISFSLNTLKEQDMKARIEFPSKNTTNILLKNNLEGKFTGSFVSSETGKHKITADGLEKFIFLNIFNNKELQKVLSTDEKIKKFAAINKNISINWYNERGIELARIYNDNIFFGKNWIGFYEKKKLKDGFYSRQSLIPWFLLLPFIIILFLLIWYRESKNS